MKISYPREFLAFRTYHPVSIRLPARQHPRLDGGLEPAVIGYPGPTMTKRDELRVRKALQGASFPANPAQLLTYATDRGADEKTRRALEALPHGSYANLEEVEEAVPQSPESDLHS